MEPEKLFGLRKNPDFADEKCIGFGHFDQKTCSDYADSDDAGFTVGANNEARLIIRLFTITVLVPFSPHGLSFLDNSPYILHLFPSYMLVSCGSLLHHRKNLSLFVLCRS